MVRRSYILFRTHLEDISYRCWCGSLLGINIKIKRMCCVQEDIAFVEILKDFVFPICVGLITYLLFAKLDDWKKRRSQSRLGVAIIDALIEEVKNGIEILDRFIKTQKPSGVALPRKSWSGMNTISDDVLLRIIEVSKDVTPEDFPPKDIRIHCKNYFDHMAPTWDTIESGQPDWHKRAAGLIRYPEAAKGVLTMLEQTRKLLETNSNRMMPK